MPAVRRCCSSSPSVTKFRSRTNLFGTPRRVALGMGAQGTQDLREVGRLLASLKEPDPPKALEGGRKAVADGQGGVGHEAGHRPPSGLPGRRFLEGPAVDLSRLPVPDLLARRRRSADHLGLVVTRGPQGVARPRRRQNLGIYRQQVIAPNQTIMRWLAHRGGALDFRDFALANPGRPFPVAVALGADPATMLGAVTPVPDALSGYQFAGLLRGSRTELADSAVGEGGLMLQVPANAEIVLEDTSRWPTRASSGPAPRRGVEGDRRPPARARRAVRRPHRLLQTSRTGSRSSRSSA